MGYRQHAGPDGRVAAGAEVDGGQGRRREEETEGQAGGVGAQVRSTGFSLSGWLG